MRRVLTGFCLASLLLSIAPDAPASDNALADRIEEDWELVVASTDTNLVGPQITMMMRPGPGSSAPSMIFNLNYRDQPSFSAGGLELQVWSGNDLSATSSEGTSMLQINNETITWTQRMTLSGGMLRYKIVSGSSTTWGAFGTSADRLSAGAATSLATLGGYDPAASVAKSRPGFQSNRVTSLTLLRVRYYQGESLLSTDSTPRPVALSN